MIRKFQRKSFKLKISVKYLPKRNILLSLKNTRKKIFGIPLPNLNPNPTKSTNPKEKEEIGRGEATTIKKITEANETTNRSQDREKEIVLVNTSKKHTTLKNKRDNTDDDEC